jgi:glycosyltransferase involved in cell wall biosynthesis
MVLTILLITSSGYFPEAVSAESIRLPVIGSDIPGIRELVVDEDSGFVVPVADAKAVSRALERIAADPDEAEQLGARGRELVQKHFSASRQASEYLSDYLRLIKPIIHNPRNAEAEDSAGSRS